MGARPEQPTALVDRYLRLCEDRDLEAAAGLLAPGVVLVFPGGQRHTSLAAMAASARGDYRWVRKRRERYFAAPLPDGSGATAVTSLGTLYGEDLAGRGFEGIRYADVFVVQDGLIAEQHVYNDLALTGISRSTAIGAPSDPPIRTRCRT